MDKTPLLLRGAPADPSLSPPLPPCPAPVDQDDKNAQEAGGLGLSLDHDSKKTADATGKTAEVSPAVKKEERKAGFRHWIVGGRGSTDEGEGSSSRYGLGALNNEHVLDIHRSPSSPSPTTTTAPGAVGAEARRSFPSRVLATLLGRNTADKVNSRNKIHALIDRTERFAGLWASHVTLADPSTNLTAALREFAAAEKEATAERLHDAAVTLYKISSSAKLESQVAGAAKVLACEAAALAGGWQGADAPNEVAASTSCSSRSPDILFYIAISGSLGLLPYLNTVIPEHMRSYVGFLFGTAFSAATVGAVMVARAVDKTDLQMATILGAICLVAFSVLVVVFVSFALTGGNIIFICVLAAILVALHIWAWFRKRYCV